MFLKERPYFGFLAPIVLNNYLTYFHWSFLTVGMKMWQSKKDSPRMVWKNITAMSMEVVPARKYGPNKSRLSLALLQVRLSPYTHIHSFIHSCSPSLSFPPSLFPLSPNIFCSAKVALQRVDKTVFPIYLTWNKPASSN